ncbi:hypothetical protein [Streptomyces sp. N2A]|uniref:hypothetical protein n=1 Tax=Streptomyces sp. N2A TaxID=3073936 RepID=UPI00286FB6D2|nr:hypothetical protein [Streptomyces sp. N2A]
MKPLPCLLICAAVAREDEAWELADAVAAARGLPIALVLSATDAASCFPHAETLNAAETAAQAFEPLSTSVVLQHVENQDYTQLVTDPRVTNEPAHPTQRPRHNTPESTTNETRELGDLGQARPFAAALRGTACSRQPCLRQPGACRLNSACV